MRFSKLRKKERKKQCCEALQVIVSIINWYFNDSAVKMNSYKKNRIMFNV